VTLFSLVHNFIFDPLLPFVLQTDEACNVFQHILSVGVKPNATTYSLLVDAHIVNRDLKGTLAVIDQMVSPNCYSKFFFCFCMKILVPFNSYYVWFRLMPVSLLQRISSRRFEDVVPVNQTLTVMRKCNHWLNSLTTEWVVKIEGSCFITYNTMLSTKQ
jgi:hypothetical protein